METKHSGRIRQPAEDPEAQPKGILPPPPAVASLIPLYHKGSRSPFLPLLHVGAHMCARFPPQRPPYFAAPRGFCLPALHLILYLISTADGGFASAVWGRPFTMHPRGERMVISGHQLPRSDLLCVLPARRFRFSAEQGTSTRTPIGSSKPTLCKPGLKGGKP
jgi:hypothetical protein